MMKILAVIVVLLLTGCRTAQMVSNTNQLTPMSQMVNQEIIDGFFDGDTTNISKEYYFLE